MDIDINNNNNSINDLDDQVVEDEDVTELLNGLELSPDRETDVNGHDDGGDNDKEEETKSWQIHDFGMMFSHIEGSIFSDFGRSEEFCIDGDALILHTYQRIAEGSVKFDKSVRDSISPEFVDSLHSQQSLYFMFHFEQYIYNLMARETKFTILFIDIHKHFYKNHSLLLLREIIIQHYSKLLRGNESVRFHVMKENYIEDPHQFGAIYRFYRDNLFSFLIILPPIFFDDLEDLYSSQGNTLFVYKSAYYFNHFVDICASEFRGSTLNSFIYSYDKRKHPCFVVPKFSIDESNKKISNDIVLHNQSVIQKLLIEDQSPIFSHFGTTLAIVSVLSSSTVLVDNAKSIPFLYNGFYLKAFCIYLALLKNLPFNQRSFDLISSIDKQDLPQLKIIHEIFQTLINHSNLNYQLVAKRFNQQEDQFDSTQLLDIIDIKFYIFVVYLIYFNQPNNNNNNNNQNNIIDGIILKEATEIWNICNRYLERKDCGELMDFRMKPELKESQLLNRIKNNSKENSIRVNDLKMYKVDNPMIDELIGSLRDQLKFESEEPTFLAPPDDPFFDVTHSHVLKLLKELPDAFQVKIKDDYKMKITNRNSEKGKQGAALRYAKLAASLYESSHKTVITELESEKVVQKEKINYQVHKQSEKKNKPTKKKDLVQEKMDKKNSDVLKKFHSAVRKAEDAAEIVSLLTEIHEDKTTEKTGYISSYIKEYNIAIARIDKKYSSQFTPDQPQLKKSLFLLLQSYLRAFDSNQFGSGSEGKETLDQFKEHIYQISRFLELRDLSNEINRIFDLKHTVLILSNREQSSVIYQMTHAQETLVRTTGQRKDPRTPYFHPDEWQRKLLDVVDQSKSALVCAATSAGKTFISFYAFEKVLRESNDGIVVYVSPTKALVNQMYAEVIGRYEKNYANIVGENNCGKYRMAGIFTRDYRIESDKCQILITVPACLDILLLSITNSDWAHRIKYIIFDEVHQIANGVEGAIWEQLLLINPAPFIALSATLGNLKEFHQWLQSTIPSRDVVLIEHQHRYNDLQLYHYDTKNKDLLDFHPCQSIKVNSNSMENIGLLLPEESIQLYDTLHKRFHATHQEEMKQLNPEFYFKDAKKKEYNLNKELIFAYQRDLKNFIQNNMNHPETKKVIEEDYPDHKISSVAWMEKTYEFIEVLKKKDKLPVILFFLHRKGCEDLAIFIKEKIDEKNQDPTKVAKIAELRIVEAKLKQEIAIHQIPQDDPIFAELEQIRAKISILTTKVPEYGTILKSDIIDDKNVLEGYHLMEPLMEGIGVHHSGLKREFNENVEQLFRRKKIKVVIATGTLSLGINMPCRTVVICGDSPYLNTLLYKQMSGRAGRRGLENRGHVVFFGVHNIRANRLVNSKLPQIVGNSVLSTSLVLRLICRYNYTHFEEPVEKRSEHQRFIIDATERLLSRSFFMRRNPIQNKLLFLFSIDFLYRNGYLDKNGQALGYSGIVNHLNYLEPYNFIIVQLFRDKIFDKYCNGNSKHDELEILNILAHLFNRERLPNLYVKPKNTTSLITLPPLPKDAKRTIESHNQRVIETFVPYIVALQNNQNSITLPLSTNFKVTQQMSDLPNWYQHISTKYIENGQFRRGILSLSGSSNVIKNFKRFEQSLPIGSFFDLSVLPFCHLPKDRLNSYIVDLYRHSQLATICDENMISEGNVFPKIKDFVITIKTIVNSLEFKQENSPVSAKFKRIQENYYKIFERAFGIKEYTKSKASLRPNIKI